MKKEAKKEKDTVDAAQFEFLCFQDEGTPLSKEMSKRLNYYCELIGSNTTKVISNILVSDEFTKAFIELTACASGNVIDCIKSHIIEAQYLATGIGVENLFYNEQYVELLMASLLKHDYNTKTRGADARNEIGSKMEYKSINLNSLSESSGSFQFHWISKDKLASYLATESVFFSLREGADIKEIWYLPMSVIYPDLEAKYLEAEGKRSILMNGGINKKKNTDAHKSYSLSTIKKMGAEKVYG